MMSEANLKLLKIDKLISLILQSVDELLAMHNGHKNLTLIDEKIDFIQIIHKVISAKQFEKQLQKQ